MKIGQRVVLKPFEGQPRQMGMVILLSSTTCCVMLDEECYDLEDPEDDGIREVAYDQVEEE